MLQERKKRQKPKGEQRTIRLYDREYCSGKCSLYSVDQKIGIGVDQNKKEIVLIIIFQEESI
jgi:hypothetical protein